jgi:beta-1,4-mannosyl-glycoprotein beta-1,4-N-acetylglucosaminyltransferase
MIYDCFTFFNELELLELRLHELADVVDKFVLVEATRTHTNKPKPLHYQENRSRFGAFQNRIIHVVVDDLPAAKNAWVPERFQRRGIGRGLAGCRPDDFVLVSDIDEIPRAATVAKISREMKFNDSFFPKLAHATLSSPLVKNIFRRKGFRRRLRLNHPFILKFEQSLFRNFLNSKSVRPPFWYGTRMLHYRDYSDAEEIVHSGYKIVKDGGWHFSYMGGVERIREKVAAYAHQERNLPEFTDPKVIAEKINRGEALFGQDWQSEFVPLDDSFPRYLLENREKFSSWIKPV